MTDVTLPYPRDEAAHVVKATFERTSSISIYEVEGDGTVIVGVTDGGLTSFGEEVIVAFPEARSGAPDGHPETVVSVTAQARRSYNLSANPWKHKAAFIEELHALKGTPVEELELSGDDRDGTADSRNDAEPADVMRLGAKALLLVLLGLSLVVALLMVVAWAL